MEQALAGKCALVTGTSGGLGSHFALTLARAGAKVVLAERRQREPHPLLDQIRSEGGQAAVVRLDVTQPESVTAAFDEAAERLGPLQ